MTHSKIVTTSSEPGLAPVVARWLVETFFNYPGTYTMEEMTALILAPSDGQKEAFVLFDGSQPVGTAAMIPPDLDARPDLTLWLAGLFVEPAFHGRGHAKVLVHQVKSFASSTAVSVLWLYTLGAEAFYARLGWVKAGMEQDRGQAVALMKRVLNQRGKSGSPFHDP